MADLVFDLPTIPDERAFAHSLLRYAQVLAKHRQCSRPTELHFKWHARIPGRRGAHYEVVIDGDFAELQAFTADLSLAIHHYARGICAITPKWRRSLIPDVFRAALFRAVVERSEEFTALTRTAIGAGALVQVNSYVFSLTGKYEVDRSLGALSQALIQWRNNRLVPSVLLEQVHTALEITLKRILSASNRDTAFGQLVSSAAQAGLVSPEELATLLKVKDIRRDSKHRGQQLSDARLQTVLATTIGVLHRLAVGLTESREPGGTSER